MTEHEKLLAGLEYDYRDPEIQQMILTAKTRLRRFNESDDPAEQSRIVAEMVGKKGRGAVILPPFRCTYGQHIELGDDVFVNMNATFLDSNKIVIGERTLLGPDVKIYCGEHALDYRHRFGTREDGSPYLITTTRPVVIGKNCWIGGNTTILPGVTIGDNVVVAAGSVVNKDVSSNCIVGGVPAKHIRAL
ncbi:sugar O-acetyltransferase [Eikenella sp. S3360]|uniref:Sugar O-acetyltransferase n=1 Tax=Eikenella glucosivorans TaxID=2766967 RepID=A0ABS0NB41_9NEIS|nr:sugar O-acetyltransferase [Eikenella glucosivorans]MBH5329508.1 sugar O-acetyltransferase [Eikenella glucosivorans]